MQTVQWSALISIQLPRYLRSEHYLKTERELPVVISLLHIPFNPAIGFVQPRVTLSSPLTLFSL